MRIILILILLFPILTVAATLTGRMVRVVDGYYHGCLIYFLLLPLPPAPPSSH